MLVALKLVTGETIFSEVIEYNDNYYVLNNPLELIRYFHETNEKYLIKPYFQFGTDRTFKISVSDIVIIKKLHPELMELTKTYLKTNIFNEETSSYLSALFLSNIN